MKQIAPLPCPEWYADNEWNVSLWGTYVLTGNEWRNDRYIERTMRGAAAWMQSISSTGILASDLKDGPSMQDASL